jgi:hypothetical protein
LAIWQEVRPWRCKSGLVYTDDIARSEVAKTQLLTDKVTLEEVKAYFQLAVDNYWHKMVK